MKIVWHWETTIVSKIGHWLTIIKGEMFSSNPVVSFVKKSKISKKCQKLTFFLVFSGHFRLPKCEDLPKHSNSTKTCTKSSITTMRWDLATSKLFNSHSFNNFINEKNDWKKGKKICPLQKGQKASIRMGYMD